MTGHALAPVVSDQIPCHQLIKSQSVAVNIRSILDWESETDYAGDPDGVTQDQLILWCS